MKKRTAKIACLALTAVISAGMLAGCKGKDKEAAGDASKNGPVTIDYMAYQMLGQPDSNSPVVKKVEEKFNTKFNFWFVNGNNLDEVLNVKFAAGEMPDVMRIQNKANLGKYKDQGILAPLSKEDMKKYMPNYVKFIDEKYPNAWKEVSYDGKLYAIPTTTYDSNYPTVITWNKQWLDNVGITKIPETLKEYEEAFYKFRNNDPDKNGKKDTYGLSDTIMPTIMGAFDYPGIYNIAQAIKKNDLASALPIFVTPDDKVVIGSIMPGNKEALATLQKWYKDGIIDPEFITGENTGGYWADSQAFFNGKVGVTGLSMFYHWRNELDPKNPNDKGGQVWQNFKKVKPDGQVVFGKPAVGPSGKSGSPAWSLTSQPTAITVKAAKDPKKIETIYKMIEALHTDKAYFNLTKFGIEGTDWETVNGAPATKHPEWKSSDGEKQGIGDVFNLGTMPDEFKRSTNPFQYEFGDKYFKYNGYRNAFIAPGAAFQKYSNNLAKIVTDGYLKIITGEKSVDYFDEMVAKFKSNGGDEVLKELNDTYLTMIGKK
ncbi:hypothetical protein NBE98_14535 [Clostridium swellfunianum]|uniref:hypothetical protein n=1 Tax=Clostridium swellfunianum TaxID=1367462 RepID=UPI00202DFBE6|nr:hypothetical protein [Clostridium swellfunianum]MCM0649582.1 hypothetical protein [Clostridium swellfunianum]